MQLRLVALLGLLAACGGAAPVAGDHSPSAAHESPIKNDEEVVLFTTAAQRSGDLWLVPVHGWVFEPEHDSVWRGGLLDAIADTVDLEPGDPRTARAERVARWFLVDNERGKRLPVRIGSASYVLPATGADGQVRHGVRVSAPANARWLDIETRARDGRTFRGRAQLVAPEGISIVSDIDDTIKVTEVLLGKRRILERTFVETFEPVVGMARRYRAWHDNGAVFHYVSASPWHLYRPLGDFLDASGFPHGTMHLRAVRFKDASALNLLRSPRTHKIAIISDLIERFGRRRFVLVGDTGESDPGIYAELARRYPAQIAAIALRRLPGDRWTDQEHARLFAGLSVQVHFFSSGDELPDLTDLAR